MTGQTYSVLRGHYSRVFTGRAEGRAPARGHCPNAEEIAANLGGIAAAGTWHEPASGIHEGEIARAALDRRYG